MTNMRSSGTNFVRSFKRRHNDWRVDMKYSIHRITEGEDELILNYRELTPEVERILQFMNRGQTRLPGRVDGETVLFAPE